MKVGRCPPDKLRSRVATERGPSPSIKVMTHYLATANLVTLCEALVTAHQTDPDLATVYEAIRISSGNSSVHETESQVILNGSRDINFTLGLMPKDIGLFQSMAEHAGVPPEISPQLITIFEDGQARFGEREWSPNMIRRLEEACGTRVTAKGFPAQIHDDEPEERGYEVMPPGKDHQQDLRYGLRVTWVLRRWVGSRSRRGLCRTGMKNKKQLRSNGLPLRITLRGTAGTIQRRDRLDF